MEIVLKVELPETECDYIEYLQYEVYSYKTILNDILIEKNPKYKYSKDNYDHFMNEYKEAVFKLELYMKEILMQYAPEYANNLDYSYNVSFAECTLNIYKKEDNCLSCKCGGAK